MLFAVGAALLAGCGRNDALPHSLFDPRGPVSRMQDGLLLTSLWFAAGIGAVVSVLLLFVVLKFRAKPGGEQKVPEQIHGNTKLEIAWTLIPILILVIMAVPSVRTAFGTSEAMTATSMTVKATGNQWWFAFEYPDYGNFAVGNELVIPVDTAVKMELRSNDVIHSFWIPKLAGKTDMIPNRVNTMWIQSDETGVFYGQCAEFCGTQHAKMRFRVKVLGKDEFAAWTKARQSPAGEPTEALAKQGKELLLKQDCIGCHAIAGTAAQGKVGPNLSNVGERSTLAAGIMENTPENMKAWIQDPHQFKTNVKMPAHPQLKDDELNAIVAYLQGLK